MGTAPPPGARVLEGIGGRLAAVLRSACAPVPALAAGTGAIGWGLGFAVPITVPAAGTTDAGVDAGALVMALFEQEGSSLVRLVRLFVDDRNAAEDLVQEAFIRLARAAGRIRDPDKAAAYLRSIVLNLARDHNRRGLVSLRHQLPFDAHRATVEDEISLHEDQRRVIDALRVLPHRQRDCLVLRYYHDLPIDGIAATLGLSPNSVKTHLRRGLAAMERHLAGPEEDT